MSDPLPVLEYAGVRHERPLGSRIEKFELPGGGVRLVDPPAGWAGVGGNVALVVIGVTWAVILFTEIAMAVSRGVYWNAMVMIGWVIFTLSCTLLLWLETRRRAKWPTVLEAAEGELRLCRPVLFFRFKRWRVDEIGDVKASLPTPTLGLHGTRMVSSLMIVGELGWFGPASRVLINRDAAEVRWVVRELRSALGMTD